MSARRTQPDDHSSLKEEKLLRNDDSPNDITFVQVMEECIVVPWTEQQSDNSNLSERSRKELCCR
ncbi:hypothetical protein T01_8313 [Trichinella spiralis]|uniref:Uncharacterized protein n=1 Tax=Trichinella spiralis TaxID=6334 RepID=A0A0V1B5I8_TRISP|nr:hypothetical protein T01_8313 [Trichinella spiralis]